jgi:predicted transcriptional regulator
MRDSPAIDLDRTTAGVTSPSIEAGRVSASELAALMLDARRMAHLAAVFSNPTRSKILVLLANHRRLSVTTLAILVGSSVSLVSHNLALMKTEGWIAVSSLGRIRQVRLANPQRMLAVRHLRDAGRLARNR